MYSQMQAHTSLTSIKDVKNETVASFQEISRLGRIKINRRDAAKGLAKQKGLRPIPGKLQ